MTDKLSTMTSPIPKWLQVNYVSLFIKFDNRKFTLDEARKCLNCKSVSVILTELRQAGWLVAHLNQKDIRKYNYELVPLNKIFRGMCAD